MLLFCVLHNQTISLCMHLTLKKGSPVFLCTSLGFLMIPATFCSFFNWSLTLNVSLACVSKLFKWKETSPLQIQFKYQTWSLRAVSACHPYPDRKRGAVMCFCVYITRSNTRPQQNTHTKSSEFDPTPVTLHEHAYCFIIVLLLSSI